MPTYKTKKEFLQNVLSEVKFPFDRKDIYNELENHIDDRINDFLEEGYTQEEAEIKAIEVMGDASIIGKKLNKIHNPIIGWIWKISNILVKILIVVVVVNVIALSKSFGYSPIDEIDKSELVYHYEYEKKAIIDNRVIEITDIAYKNDGTLYLEFKTYNKSILSNTWSFWYIGTISDEYGNEFYGNGGSSGSITSYSYIIIDDFPEESKTLNIVYDNYNRHFEFHFNLETGEAYE